MKDKKLPVKCMMLALVLASSAQAQTKKSDRSRGMGTYTYHTGDTVLRVEKQEDDPRTRHITWYKEDAVYKIKVVDDKIASVVVNGKELTREEWSTQEAAIQGLLDKIKRDEEQAARYREQAEVYRKEAEGYRKQAEGFRTEAAAHRVAAAQHRKEGEKVRAQAALHREQAEKIRVESAQYRVEAAKVREQAEVHRKQAEVYRKEAEVHRQQADEHRKMAAVHRKEAEEHRKTMEALVDDLVKEKIIANREALNKVELTEEAFLVNDEKQSNALHQQFKAKYLKKPGAKLNFKVGASHSYYFDNN